MGATATTLLNYIKKMKFVLVFILLLRYYSSFSQAAGTLDATFGDNGIKERPFATVNMHILPDEKMLINSLNLMRLNPDCSIDSSFGIDGVSAAYSGIFDVFPDGRIAISSLVEEVPNGILNVLKVTVLHPNGMVDLTYGINGEARLVFPKGISIAGIVCHPNGTIFAAGSIYNSSPTSLKSDLYVTRFTTGGVADIGGAPYWIPDPYDFTPSLENFNFNFSSGLCLQPDGNVVLCGAVSGYTGTVYQNYRRFYLHRFLPDGAHDLSFGYNGHLLDQIGSESTAYSVLTTSDNFIYAVGISDNNASVVAKYNTDGDRVSSYGIQGAAKISGILCRRFTRQPDGKIVVVGTLSTSSPDLVVARLKVNGTLDPSFSDDGISSIPYDPDIAYYPNDIEMLSTGKILVSGRKMTPGGMFARFNSALFVAAKEPFAKEIQKAVMIPNQLINQTQVTVQYHINERVDQDAVIVYSNGHLEPVQVESNGDGDSLTAQIPEHLASGVYHLLFMDGSVPVRATFVKVR